MSNCLCHGVILYFVSSLSSTLSVVIRRDLFVRLFHFCVCQYETVVMNTTFSCHHRILHSYKALEIRKLTKILKSPCLAIITMKKCANHRLKFSQAADQQLLLHAVERRRAAAMSQSEYATIVLCSAHSWLRRLR